MDKATCCVVGCASPVRGKIRRLCSMHYHCITYCSVDGCEKPSHGNGLCNTHYRRMARKGTPTPRPVGSVVDGLKICSACKIDKPLSDFGVNRALASGVHIYCKSCTNETSAAYRKVIGSEAVNAQAKAQRQANPYYWRAGNNTRRARIFGRENELVVPTTVFDRDNWTCQICFVPVARVVQWPHPLYATVDHIIPLARGGNHLYSNCQTACWACNFEKRDHMPDDLMRRTA